MKNRKLDRQDNSLDEQMTKELKAGFAWLFIYPFCVYTSWYFQSKDRKQ